MWSCRRRFLDSHLSRQLYRWGSVIAGYIFVASFCIYKLYIYMCVCYIYKLYSFFLQFDTAWLVEDQFRFLGCTLHLMP